MTTGQTEESRHDDSPDLLLARAFLVVRTSAFRFAAGRADPSLPRTTRSACDRNRSRPDPDVHPAGHDFAAGAYVSLRAALLRDSWRDRRRRLGWTKQRQRATPAALRIQASLRPARSAVLERHGHRTPA